MKYKVKYLPSLSQDIRRIAEALEEYPNKAKRLLKEMDEKLLKLEEMPNMWPVFYARPKYRKMVLEDHLLFYTVDEKHRVVRICRILYGKKDISSQLED